jgi:hypothetical protein
MNQGRNALGAVSITGGKYRGLKAKVLGCTKKMVRLQLNGCKGEVRVIKGNISMTCKEC